MNKKLLALVGAAFVAVGINSAVSQSDEPSMSCAKGETVIFTSDVPDIAEFDAASHGAKLVQVMTIPAQGEGLNLYVFAPGQIVCVISAEVDQTNIRSQEQK